MSYDPSIGTWMEEDPKHYVDGANMYDFEESNPVDHDDPTGTLTVYVWDGGKDGSSKKSMGHVAIKLNDGTYISWYPTDPNANAETDCPAVVNETQGQDENKEGGPANRTIVINGLDEAAIEKWWNDYQKTHTNWSIRTSCASTAEGALNAGKPQWYDKNHDGASDALPVTPGEVENYALRIQQTEQKGRGFFYKAWSFVWGSVNNHEDNEDDRGE